MLYKSAICYSMNDWVSHAGLYQCCWVSHTDLYVAVFLIHANMNNNEGQSTGQDCYM